MGVKKISVPKEYISNFFGAMKGSTPYDKSDKRNNS